MPEYGGTRLALAEVVMRPWRTEAPLARLRAEMGYQFKAERKVPSFDALRWRGIPAGRPLLLNHEPWKVDDDRDDDRIDTEIASRDLPRSQVEHLTEAVIGAKALRGPVWVWGAGGMTSPRAHNTDADRAWFAWSYAPVFERLSNLLQPLYVTPSVEGDMRALAGEVHRSMRLARSMAAAFGLDLYVCLNVVKRSGRPIEAEELRVLFASARSFGAAGVVWWCGAAAEESARRYADVFSIHAELIGKLGG